MSTPEERDKTDVNYRYFVMLLQQIAVDKSIQGGGSLRVLDYGCGRGTIVELLREAGFDALKHLQRILADDGVMQHHFPSKEVIKEGHIGIPMAHWFRPGRARTLYTTVLRKMGMGFFKEQAATPQAWVERQLNWIDLYCSYTPYREVQQIIGENYILTHREIDYCLFRAQSKPLLKKLLAVRPLTGIYQRLFRRLAFMVIRLEKRPEAFLNLPQRDVPTYAVAEQKNIETESAHATSRLS